VRLFSNNQNRQEQSNQRHRWLSKLQSRVAIVTGGGTGQGKAIASAMAREGANIVIASLTRERAKIPSTEITTLISDVDLQNVAKELETLGVTALGIPFDVTVQEDVSSLANQTLQSFGRIDILVNCAGLLLEMPVVEHNDRSWQKVLDVNLTGTYRCTKAVLPTMMKNQWGRIINISSTAGNVGAANWAAYCASKHGVIGFTRALALEIASQGITANAICPTWIESGMMKDWAARAAKTEGKTYEEKMKEIADQNPQKRILQAEEVGNIAVFLASPESYGINGADITVSGGALW